MFSNVRSTPGLTVLALLAATGFAPSVASAQFFDRLSNPKITVALAHPPGLGLKVTRIAFGPVRGDKVDQVVDAITGDFVAGGMEVLDRQHLNSLLSEHQLNLSGYVDQATAMKMGQFLGSTALVFVNTLRSATEQHQLYNNWQDSRGIRHVDHIAETQVFLKVSIQTVDLTTGRTLEARVVDANPKAQNKVTDQYGYPVYPPEFDLQDAAIREVVGNVHRLFLSWRESRQVYFFDDGNCQLKAAFSLLKGGDLAGATKQSIENVETCKANPKMNDKTNAHALYNVGISAFLAGDNEKALDYLRQAQRVKDMGITTDAMVEVNRALALAAESRAVDARTAAALASQAQNPPVTQVAATPAGGPAAPPATEAAHAPAATPAQTHGAPAASRTGAQPGPKTASLARTSGAATTKATPSAADRLRSLNDLLSQGLISKEDFAQKKAEILKSM